MGLWKRIKGAFDRGGVKLRFDSPGVFRWKDASLPVAVELTNTSDAERVVTHLLVRISEDTTERDRAERERSGGSGSGRSRSSSRSSSTTSGTARTYITFDHDTEVRLAPGATATVELEVPLSMRGALDATEGADELPGWVSTAASALGTFQDLTRDEQWYQLSVRHTVEGYKAAATRSRRIRHLRPGEIHKGGWTIGFG